MEIFIFLLLPLLVGLLSFFIRKGKFLSYLTIFVSVIDFFLAFHFLEVLAKSHTHKFILVSKWIELDSLSEIFLLLLSFIYLGVSLFSSWYLEGSSSKKYGEYYVNLNLFVFSILLLPLLPNPGMVWLAIELMTLFSILLVNFYDTRIALEATWKYVILSLLGAALVLFGLMLLLGSAYQKGVINPTWKSLASISHSLSPTILLSSFVFIFIGLGTKIGIVPLHSWLPDVYSQTPPPVCALFSGAETSVILYVFFRIFPIFSHLTSVHSLFVIFGLLSMGVAAFLLLGVKDYQRMFAFSTIEQVGIVLIAIGLTGKSSSFPALLQTFSHSLVKTLCFF
jgi:hydrogenase-4 component F